MTQAVIYMRCSGVSQVDGDTFERQEESCRRCAAHMGLEVVGLYREAITGKTDGDERPEFTRMIGELLDQQDGPRLIIVENQTRLARRLSAQEQILMMLAIKHIEIILADICANVTREWLEDKDRCLQHQIMGAISEWDRKTLVSRMSAAKARIRRNEPGRRVDGPPPYGHDPERPDETRGLAIMRQIDAHRYLTLKKWLAMGGDPQSHRPRITDKDIAEALDAMKVPTRGTKRNGHRPWHWKVVWDLLSKK